MESAYNRRVLRIVWTNVLCNPAVSSCVGEKEERGDQVISQNVFQSFLCLARAVFLSTSNLKFSEHLSLVWM